MPEATNNPTTLTPRIVRVTALFAVTLHQPGKTRRAPPRVITGQLVAKAYQGDTLHHYRVQGDDGVLYLAPPGWLAPERVADVQRMVVRVQLLQQAKLIADIRELIAPYSSVSEPVA